MLFSDTANSEQRRVMRRRRPSDAADVTMSANSLGFSLYFHFHVAVIWRENFYCFHAAAILRENCAWPVVRGLDSHTADLTRELAVCGLPL